MVVLNEIVRRNRRVKDHLQKHAEPIAAVSVGLIFASLGFGAAAGLQYIEGPVELEELDAQAADWDAAWARHAFMVAELRGAVAGNETALAHVEALSAQTTGLLGPRPEVVNTNWTPTGAVYFVFTLISTIGYGTFAPQTSHGKALTVVIGFVGAAVFGLWMNYVGKVVHHCSKRIGRACCGSGSLAPLCGLFVFFVAYWLLGALAFEELALQAGDLWSFGDSAYYAAITFTTIGLGDYSLRWYGQNSALEVALFMAFTIVGLSIFIEVANSVSDAVKKTYNKEGEGTAKTEAKLEELPSDVKDLGRGRSGSEDYVNLRETASNSVGLEVVPVIHSQVYVQTGSHMSQSRKDVMK